MKNRIKLKLKAYEQPALQKFKNILLQMERGNIGTKEALQQVERQMNEQAVQVQRRVGKKVKEGKEFRELPTKKCPDCDKGTMTLSRADSNDPDLAVWACRSCRYSQYEGKTFMEYIEEFEKRRKK